MQLRTIQQPGPVNGVQPRTITVISKGRITCIPVKEITHISRQGNASVIYTPGQKIYTCYSLQDLLKALPAGEFYRVHRTYIVCLKKITSKYKRKILVGEHQLYISLYYERNIIKELARLLDETLQFMEP